MITITIGQETRTLGEATEPWVNQQVNQQVNRRRADGNGVCVQVRIDDPPLNLLLSTPQCQRRGGGGGGLNDREQRIVDLWIKNRLNQADFAGGNVIAFLKQLKP